ncbi:MAG: hypothetical protein P8J32_07140 [bacterium]|nr:hypothetical protein [bacterium]
MRLSRTRQDTFDYISKTARESTGFMRLSSPLIFRRFLREPDDSIVYVVGMLPMGNGLNEKLTSIGIRDDDIAVELKLK